MSAPQFVRLVTTAQLVSMLAAVVAAVIEIETIVVTGPLLSLSGLVMAGWSFYRGARLGFYFGLTAPTIAVICFAVIYGFSWGPSEAATPIASLLFVFGVGCIPLAFLALRETDPTPVFRSATPPQFSLAALLVWTLAVSLPLGFYRLGPVGAALGVLGSYALLVGYALVHFHATRAATREIDFPWGNDKNDPGDILPPKGSVDATL